MSNLKFKRKIDTYIKDDKLGSRINQIRSIDDFRIHINKTSKDLLKISLSDEESNARTKFLEKYEKVDFDSIYYVASVKEFAYFINLLLTESEEKVRSKYLFRGVSTLDQMLPTIKRENNTWKDNEFEYISKFEENASLSLGQFNNPIDLGSAAQHYGIKTRLLDWSYSPLIATLFSLYGKLDDDYYYGVVFRDYDNSLTLKKLPYKADSFDSMSVKYRNMMDRLDSLYDEISTLSDKTRNEIGHSREQHLLDYFDSFGDKEKDPSKAKSIIAKAITYCQQIVESTNDKRILNKSKETTNKLVVDLLSTKTMIFLETNYSNSRLLNQRGLFEVCLDKYYNPFSNNSLLLIDPTARNEIIKYIDRLGFNYYMLMNDPENQSITVNKTLSNDLNFKREVEYK